MVKLPFFDWAILSSFALFIVLRWSATRREIASGYPLILNNDSLDLALTAVSFVAQMDLRVVPIAHGVWALLVVWVELAGFRYSILRWKNILVNSTNYSGRVAKIPISFNGIYFELHVLLGYMLLLLYLILPRRLTAQLSFAHDMSRIRLTFLVVINEYFAILFVFNNDPSFMFIGIFSGLVHVTHTAHVPMMGKLGDTHLTVDFITIARLALTSESVTFATLFSFSITQNRRKPWRYLTLIQPIRRFYFLIDYAYLSWGCLEILLACIEYLSSSSGTVLH